MKKTYVVTTDKKIYHIGAYSKLEAYQKAKTGIEGEKILQCEGIEDQELRYFEQGLSLPSIFVLCPKGVS